MSLENNFKYSNIVNELNLIFKNIDDNIKKDLFEKHNLKTRNRDLSFTDTLIYKFLYSKPESTKLSIVSSQNFDNKLNLSTTAYNYRDKQIDLSFYKNLYNKISSLYKKLMNIDPKKPFIFCADGTFNNINSKNIKDNLETSLNMGYFDVTNNIPIEISLEGEKNKNNELITLRKYIEKSNIPKKSILILDRAYCSYDFIDYLINSDYKFIIRFRNNCKNFDKIKNEKNIRILKYFDEFKTNIPYDKFKKYIGLKKNKGKYKVINKNNNDEDNKKILNNTVFSSADIIMKYEYTLLTNINIDDYNDEKIKDLYKQRWDIEIFFKLLKYNFKFENLIEHNKEQNTEQCQKLYLINLIIIMISKIIDKTYMHNNKIKKNFTKYNRKGKIIKCVYKSNKSNIIKGVYKLLTPLIKGTLKVEDYKNVCNIYVKYHISELGKYKERKAKTPFLKWYVKGHSNRSLLCKFIEAFILKNEDKLNKNHKMLFKNCNIKLKYLKKSFDS
jgi:hypothetical protein